MRYSLLTRVLILSCIVLFTSRLVAQTPAIDSLNYTKGIQQAVALYQQFVEPSAGLYNGNEYIDYSFTIEKGSPFFMLDAFTPGTVLYDGVVYDKVPMQYDMVEGKLVVKDPYGIYKFALINERVSAFSLMGHQFVRLVEPTSGKSVITTGFYDVLYDGNVQLYKSEKRKIEETISISEGIKRNVVGAAYFYLRKDNNFYEINNKSALLSLFQNKKKDVQQFIRKNKLDLRKDRDNAYTRIAAYYDSINR